MGTYTVEVTSPVVPDFSLQSRPKTVTATADIEYYPGFFYADSVRGFLEEGEAQLFRITQSGPYDTVAIVPVVNESVLFENVVLGDYLLSVFTDTNFFQTKEFNFTADSITTDTVQFIPTYFESALEWDSANVLLLRDFITDTLAMLRVPPPLTPDDGDGIIGLLVESDFAEDAASGRIEARRRVKKAGCSLRRRTIAGGGRPENEEEWQLIAYKETDDNGEVNFGFLPNGEYRINIQYPGIPMDPDSFIEFVITEEEEQDGYELAATVTEEGITVEVVEELGFFRKYFRELDVYPNPVSTELTIRYDKLMAETVEVVLMGLNGEIYIQDEVRKGWNKELVLDMRDIPNGIYLLYFYDPLRRQEKLVTFKILVRH
jgi:hypothetical protein